jgi:hypothetical protein
MAGRYGAYDYQAPHDGWRDPRDAAPLGARRLKPLCLALYLCVRCLRHPVAMQCSRFECTVLLQVVRIVTLPLCCRPTIGTCQLRIGSELWRTRSMAVLQCRTVAKLQVCRMLRLIVWPGTPDTCWTYSRGPALEPPPYRSAGPSDLYDHARHDSYVPAVEGRRERSRSRPYPQEPPPTAGGRAAAAGRPPATSGPPGTEHKLPQAAYVQRQQLRWMLKLRLQQVCFWLTVLVYRARRQPA